MVVVAVAGLVVAMGMGMRVVLAWTSVDRVGFDPADARGSLESPDNTNLGTPTTVAFIEEMLDLEPVEPVVGGELATSPDEFSTSFRSADDEGLDVYLILGSDEREALGENRRADTIILFIRPQDGSIPILISIPRDLYIPNPCTGEKTRVNANLNGCGSYANGPEQMAIAIENFTGINVDHFVVFTFEGFQRIVDRVGGVRICTSTAVRDWRTSPVALDLPAGCTVADGYQTLAWVRSRKTEGFVDGQWVRIAAGDLTRNQRQQDVIIQALEKLSRMKDLSELTALVQELAPEVALDEGLSLSDAVALAWSFRTVDIGALQRPVLPVADYIDPAGRYVLVPKASFESVVVAANPALAQYFTG
jgi:LCP family protein required for cell wall assembly